ncbi:hypothetical protein [Agarivorans sp. Alg241-V36]|uniref:hypothetical protein n=1 Tax=Agarivorans sp. Alg241-V36 TaxID=2305992 RepID=UPI0013D07EDC|nr:hypothetical protein [Agarivorans sp. Alg241-V36]
MNKLLLSALISATLSANALAASLDVYGEIKVHGVTVIDENGMLVASGPTAAVSLDEYFYVSGITYERRHTNNSNSEFTYYSTEAFATDGSYTESVKDSDNNLSYTYQEFPTNYGYQYQVATADGAMSCSGEVHESISQELPDSLSVGANYAVIGDSLKTWQCNFGEVDDDVTEEKTIYSILAQSSYQLGETTLEECIIVRAYSLTVNNDYPSSSDSMEVRCKNIGLVERSNQGSRLETLSYQQLETSSSRALSNGSQIRLPMTRLPILNAEK